MNSKEIMKKKINIRYSVVSIMAYIVLVVPILLFFLGWLKLYLGAVFSAILLTGTFYVIKKDCLSSTKTIQIELIQLIEIVVFVAVIVLFVGNCGVSVSNPDTPYRTATLRDLVNYKWPAYYESNDSYMLYYLGFWLVPAAVGKVFGWGAALFTQWMWTTLIVLISLFLLFFVLKADSKKIFWLITIVLFTWTGLNLLGYICMGVFGKIPDYCPVLSTMENYCDSLFNGESFYFVYRSNFNFLYDPYNQLMMWIVVPLMYGEKKISNYAFIGLLLLPYSPWGVAGVALIMVIDALIQLKTYLAQKRFIQFIKDVFSIPNLCAIFSVFIVFALYYSSSTRLDQDSASFGILSLSKFDRLRIGGLIIFWLCEFGIYYMFLWKKYKKDVLFITMLPLLMFIPIVWAGQISSRDFCMNVSYPLLFILMIYMINYIKDEVIGHKFNLRIGLFSAVMTIALLSTVLHSAGKVSDMYRERSLVVQNDSIYTFSDKNPEDYLNFVNPNWRGQPFFEYFAKNTQE